MNRSKKYGLTLFIFLSIILHILLFSKWHFHLPQNKLGPSTITILELQLSEHPLTIDQDISLKENAQAKLPPVKNIELLPTQPSLKLVGNNNTIENTQLQLDQVDIANRNQEENSSPINMPSDFTPYSWVEIQFQVYSGDNEILMGTGMHHYEASDNSHYEMQVSGKQQSEDEEKWELNIKGRVFMSTLSPSIYQRRGSIANRLMALSDVSATYSPSQGQFPDSISDRQSLSYQFMISPPKNQPGSILLSDGKNIINYIYDTPIIGITSSPYFGSIRTIKIILKSTKDSDSIELTLAPDFKYLPLEIKHVDIHSNITKQISTAINYK